MKALKKALTRPGFGNVCLCNLFALSVFLAPVALLFAFRFAEHGERELNSHYYYIRTTIALLVIGLCLAGLMVVLGAGFSSPLILGGLALFLATALLTAVRCARGCLRALRREAPNNYKSYLL